MVLQQGKPCPVWGTGEAGDGPISFSFEAGEQSTASKQPISIRADGHWRFILPALKAGGPFTLTISGGKNTITLKDVYVGEVWICSGQSNMQFGLGGAMNAKQAIAAAKNPKIRLFTVPQATPDKPRHDLPGGHWVECTPQTVPGFSAVGYFFGRDLQKALDVPIGLINNSWGGTRAEAWTSRPVLEAHPQYKGEFPAQEKAVANYPRALEKYKEAMAKYKEEAARAKAEGKPVPKQPSPPWNPATNANAPSVLYNGMIAPLIPYAIRGVIWYQGESNAGRPDLYCELFSMMIKNWRDDWKQGDFPFLFVQLAPFMDIVKEPTDTHWARLRKSQLQTSQRVPHTAMAVITDVGDEKDIHPRKKEPVGHRLALAAFAQVYGKKIESSGPIYCGMTIEGNKAVLSFTHVDGGLMVKGEALTGFTIAGEDRQFHNAEAEIRGDKVVVWSNRVDKPIAVRFGWANYPVVNFWNKANLPASPFRTDDFPFGLPRK